MELNSLAVLGWIIGTYASSTVVFKNRIGQCHTNTMDKLYPYQWKDLERKQTKDFLFVTKIRIAARFNCQIEAAHSVQTISASQWSQ